MFLPKRHPLSRESYAVETLTIGISPEIAYPAIPDFMHKSDSPSQQRMSMNIFWDIGTLPIVPVLQLRDRIFSDIKKHWLRSARPNNTQIS